MEKLFALVDCNNFYVSCERLFRPELRNRPVVVLSNNDGCIIARSNEAKALGIDMAAPYFKSKELIRRHQVRVFSSNYALYGNLSHRVMTILQEMEGKVEIYSIDEAFIALPVDSHFDITAYAAQVRERIFQCVGISVSIGIGTTKTLAKIANRIAKKEAAHHGVFIFPSGNHGDKLLTQIEVGDVWGIGRRSTEKLHRHGIITALHLKKADQKWIRRQLTVTGARTVMELNDISCIALDQAVGNRKSVLSSRSFKKPVQSLDELKEAVATYAALASAKLRGQNLVAGALQVFIATNSFATQLTPYANSQMLTLSAPTAHTPTLITLALKGLAIIYREGRGYQKAGVMLTDLCHKECRQQNLFTAPNQDSATLMAALDNINDRWGRNTLHYAAEGISKPWAMRQDFKSPAYTSKWQELPLVHCR
ncbi:MAG: Y-family DNA polymerase [Proteobacteria bacterium]|nr:Y-family DNA polymerase [Pseudomonadota bacterium]MBU1639716.1 Y-family DNA polymerase [Pseudomonadota bacterium]